MKALEYTAVGIPWIASDFPPYQELKNIGTMVKNSPEAWIKAMSDVIDNLQEYNDKATKNVEYAKNMSLDNNILKTVELYKKIMDKPYKW